MRGHSYENKAKRKFSEEKCLIYGTWSPLGQGGFCKKKKQRNRVGMKSATNVPYYETAATKKKQKEQDCPTSAVCAADA